MNSTPIKPTAGNGKVDEVRTRPNYPSNYPNAGFTKNFVGSGKKGKSKVVWVCSDCGYSGGQWWGTCRSCNKVGTLKQFSVPDDVEGGKVYGFEASENAMRSWLPKQKQSGPVRLSEVSRGTNHLDWRIRL